MSVYLDTSALAKRYLNETRSDEFEAFLLGAADPTISSLVLVEMRSLLARKRRGHELDAATEAGAFAHLEEDIDRGFLLLRPLQDSHAFAAARLIERLQKHSLRTLDAVHLATAEALNVAELATADRTMAAAAADMRMRITFFG